MVVLLDVSVPVPVDAVAASGAVSVGIARSKDLCSVRGSSAFSPEDPSESSQGVKTSFFRLCGT